MAANTGVKVAQNSNAAKDDNFTSIQTGLTEDQLVSKLNVLNNDAGSASFYSLLQSTSGLSSTSQFPIVTKAFSANGATITFNPDGTLQYDASALSSGLQSLRAGEYMTDSFVYTVRMGNGALSTATVTLQVAGVNDVAHITGTANGGVTEDGATAANGTLTVNDADHGESAFKADMVATSEYGNFTFNNGAWSYTLRNDDANVQALRGSDVVTDTMTVTSLDGSASQTITATVHGTNDAAQISGDASGSVAEDTVATASGQLTVHDVDTGENVFRSLDGSTLAGKYGDFTFNDGAWGYTLRDGDANVQALRGTDEVTDELTVKSADGTATQTIVVTVHGTNDAANIGGNNSGSVTEDGNGTAGGTLTVSDVDTGEAAFAAVAADKLHGEFGDFTFDAASGAWTYTLRNDDANVQALNSTSAASDNLIVKSLDGSAGETIHVTITGADEVVVPPNSVVTHSVSSGQAGKDGKQAINGFDSNDLLSYSKNLILTGFAVTDTDGNGTADTTVYFDYKNDPGHHLEVTLVGFTDLQASQIV